MSMSMTKMVEMVEAREMTLKIAQLFELIKYPLRMLCPENKG